MIMIQSFLGEIRFMHCVRGARLHDQSIRLFGVSRSLMRKLRVPGKWCGLAERGC